MMRNQNRSQRGFTLVEMSIVITIMAMMITVGIMTANRVARESLGRAQGQHMKEIGKALDSYMQQNYLQLRTAAPVVAGFANPNVPTIAEMRTVGLLDATFSTTAFNGAAYAIAVTRTPAGCVADACDLDSMVYTTAGFLDQDNVAPDVNVLGTALDEMGAGGGMATAAAPGTIGGFSGGWNRANPNGAVGGILAFRTTYPASAASTAYRRDGALPLTAAFEMNNNQINSLAAVASGAACVGEGAMARLNAAPYSIMSCVSGVWRDATQWRQSVANFASLPAAGNAAGDSRTTRNDGRLYVWSGTAWKSPVEDTSGNLIATTALCQGSSANCLTTLPRFSLVGQYVTVANSVITKPTCAAGDVAKIDVVPQTHNETVGTSYRYFAQDNGPSWTVKIQYYTVSAVWAGPITYYWADLGGATALAQVYCYH